MSLFEWKDSYSVSVDKYDNQHKKLIGLINELHAAMSSGKAKDALSKILDELITYTKTHFADEEAEFKKHSYPGYLVQKNEHEKLTNEVVKFYEEFKNGKTNLSIEMISFLKDWLLNHILITDKKYSTFFAAKGVK